MNKTLRLFGSLNRIRSAKVLFLIIALVAVIGLSMAACDNGTTGSDSGGGSDPASVTYKYSKGDTEYELTITKSTAKAVEYTPASGDTYVLLIIKGTDIKKSTGIVASYSTTKITLQPSNSTIIFSVETSSDGSVTKITGTITLEGSGGDTVVAPDKPGTSSGGGGGGGGGSGGSGGSSGNNQTPAEKLAADINSIKSGSATVNGTTVTITGGFVGVYADLTVPAGVTLDVTGDGVALGLHDATLTVNGTVNAGPGYIRLEDSANWGTINGSGIIYLKSKGSLLGVNGNRNVANRKLTLDGVTLVGLPDNSESLVYVISGGDGRTGTFIMKSGTIKGNANEGWGGGGVYINKGGTFIMESGTISGNVDGVWLEGGSFIMSGGIIENCITGVGTNGNGVSITMSGGTIKNNANNGITLLDDSKNCVVNISGGKIESYDDTVSLRGTNHSLTMSDGAIISTHEVGIELQDNSRNCTVSISGGTINGKQNGVIIDGTRHNITMSGGTISGDDENGIDLHGIENNFTMSGGDISKSGRWGLEVRGSNTGFEKETGAIIYGNSGDNKNGEGAIFVKCEANEANNLELRGDAATDVVYAAKINADKTAITGKQPAAW